MTWILTAIYLYTSRKIPPVSLSYTRKEKKLTAVTLLSQKKQKEKIWWWPFLGKSKPKEAGGLKFGNLSVMFFFFFIINFNSYPTLFFMLWPIPTKNQVNINISPNTWASKPMSFCPSIWHICLHWVLWG